MHQTAFASDYTGMVDSGAQWLVANLPKIRLVGIDYLSIATSDDLYRTHVTLLSKVLIVGAHISGQLLNVHSKCRLAE